MTHERVAATRIPALAQFGIRVLGKAVDVAPLEGDPPGRLTVLLRVDSAEAAERWFRSDAYRRAAAARRPVSRVTATVVPTSRTRAEPYSRG